MKKKLVLILIALALVLAGVLSFIFREQAQGPPIVGELALEPSDTEAEAGDIFQVDVNFKTGTNGEALAISTVGFRLTYAHEGITVESVAPSGMLSEDPDWTFPVNSVTTADGVTTIDFAAADTSVDGFTQANLVSLATINFKADDGFDQGSFSLEFDTDKSVMMTKEPPTADILNIPTNLNYAILSQ